MVSKALISTAMVVGSLVGMTNSARAQVVPPVQPVNRPIRISLGVLFPTESELRDDFGNTFFRYGASYDFAKTTAINPVVFSAYLDGATKSKEVNSINARLTYLGVGGSLRYYFNPPILPTRFYAGAGLGVYFLNGKVSVSNGQGGFDSASENKTQLGGKIFGGVELAQGFFGEASFTYINDVFDTNVSGIGLSVGYRF